MNIVLGVTGSIAAYKAADITSRFKSWGITWMLSSLKAAAG